MDRMMSNALATATRDFGAPPASFEVEFEESVDASNQHVMTVSLYRRGLDPLALLGQIFLIGAGPLALGMALSGNGLLGMSVSILVVGLGIAIRQTRRKIFRNPKPSRTYSVRRIPQAAPGIP